jgi:hypothetical protein
MIKSMTDHPCQMMLRGEYARGGASVWRDLCVGQEITNELRPRHPQGLDAIPILPGTKRERIGQAVQIRVCLVGRACVQSVGHRIDWIDAEGARRHGHVLAPRHRRRRHLSGSVGLWHKPKPVALAPYGSPSYLHLRARLRLE